ncbi:MAG TPA: nitroreductase [Geminicoccaceae bacterium]|jgi:nitroreductase|nr:nitroreductase [Geminicoccaceae bacterium]
MDALAALSTRHSIAPPFLTGPGPDAQMLAEILAAGASAPDHGRLRPWRFIVIRGEARERLGEVFAEALLKRQPDARAEALEQERGRPMRAPVVIAVVLKLDPQHPKIPEIEQILSTGAAVENILLAAHAQGFGAKWLTGANAYDDHVKAALGLTGDDRLAGFVHLGTVDGNPPQVPHADARDLTVEWPG